MNQQLEQRTYSAVLCRACREPIPVPAIVIQLQNENQNLHEAKHDRVFRLRCRSCEAEKPYRASQIIEVEGEPKRRRAVPRSSLGYPPFARAAGA